MPRAILILGASVRAAATSSRRAGLNPFGIDLFADRDLATIGTAHRVEPASYPKGLFEAAELAPEAPWFYTGALENHPALIDQLAERRPLWGVSGEALRIVRDPLAVADLLHSRGLPALEVQLDPDRVPRDGSWLVKPIASASGRGIRPWNQTARLPEEPVYFQPWVRGGLNCSAIFLARPDGCELVGMTVQWLGKPGNPFSYRGSLGPLPMSEPSRAQVERIGHALVEGFGLLGLFGVDLVLQGDCPWPVEVNPRYTASVEVLEWVTGRRLIDEHRRAFENRPVAMIRSENSGRPPAVGKVILEAPGDCQAPGLDVVEPIPDDGGEVMPRLADIPQPGTFLKAGSPVLTLLQAGQSLADCQSRLERRLERWRSRLENAPWRISGL